MDNPIMKLLLVDNVFEFIITYGVLVVIACLIIDMFKACSAIIEINERQKKKERR